MHQSGVLTVLFCCYMLCLCVCVCVCARVRACACMRACVCVPACMLSCMCVLYSIDLMLRALFLKIFLCFVVGESAGIL